jgi:hypothetical protein
MDGAIQSGERAAHEVLTLLSAHNGHIHSPVAPFEPDEPVDALEPCQPRPLEYSTFEKYLPRPRQAIALVSGAVLLGIVLVAAVVRRASFKAR